jgi:hypothetical protein
MSLFFTIVPPEPYNFVYWVGCDLIFHTVLHSKDSILNVPATVGFEKPAGLLCRAGLHYDKPYVTARGQAFADAIVDFYNQMMHIPPGRVYDVLFDCVGDNIYNVRFTRKL